MYTTDHLDSAAEAPASQRRFTAWPLLASATGVLGLVALFSETRVDANGTDYDHPVTAEAAAALSHEAFRLAGILGYLAALGLLVLAAVWHQRVARHFPASTGAHLVTFSAVATSALVTLAFGWRGALGNYLPGGGEHGTYDDQGLYAYYMMNDFSPYIAFVPLLGACFGLAWMAFGDRLVSRVLGAVAGVFAAALLGAVAVAGVPGLPAMVLLGLVVAGIWLAVGRSPITTAWPE
ncbi:hypothetical protein [Nocardioides sp. SR21]|uniref:hypothetical protein n=1 Tax=Nocardioides sp. SR21 TaxID=2919501 RepID=UPI001FAA0D1E|nr:hypothetical protein [Nocardioides sp. SR21]